MARLLGRGEKTTKLGVTQLYYTFLRSLRTQRKKFAFLQLVARIEDVLVKEFAWHIQSETKGRRFAVTDAGNARQQKFDLAVLKGRLSGKTGECIIVALIEAKYLANRDKAWKFSAEDEITRSLRALAEQVRKFKRPRHYKFPVELSARANDVYGLVFVSYVSDERREEGKEAFFNKVLGKPAAQKFRYHDLQSPRLDRVYDDVKVQLLGGFRYSTLRAGLWKRIGS